FIDGNEHQRGGGEADQCMSAKSGRTTAKAAFQSDESAGGDGRQKPQDHDDMIFVHARAPSRNLPGACRLLSFSAQSRVGGMEDDGNETTALSGDGLDLGVEDIAFSALSLDQLGATRVGFYLAP